MKISNLSIDVEQLKGGLVVDPDGVAFRIICFYIDFQGFSNKSEKNSGYTVSFQNDSKQNLEFEKLLRELPFEDE